MSAFTFVLFQSVNLSRDENIALSIRAVNKECSLEKKKKHSSLSQCR